MALNKLPIKDKSSKRLLQIIVDNRERKLMALLDKKKDTITYNSEQLDIADIIISDEVAIERKEGFDFVTSIIDNRLFEQLISSWFNLSGQFSYLLLSSILNIGDMRNVFWYIEEVISIEYNILFFFIPFLIINIFLVILIFYMVNKLYLLPQNQNLKAP